MESVPSTCTLPGFCHSERWSAEKQIPRCARNDNLVGVGSNASYRATRYLFVTISQVEREHE